MSHLPRQLTLQDHDILEFVRVDQLFPEDFQHLARIIRRVQRGDSEYDWVRGRQAGYRLFKLHLGAFSSSL